MTCNSAFEQGHLEPWRYINAFIIIIEINLNYHISASAHRDLAILCAHIRVIMPLLSFRVLLFAPDFFVISSSHQINVVYETDAAGYSVTLSLILTVPMQSSRIFCMISEENILKNVEDIILWHNSVCPQRCLECGVYVTSMQYHELGAL